MSNAIVIPIVAIMAGIAIVFLCIIIGRRKKIESQEKIKDFQEAIQQERSKENKK